ncbi:hypothetical protein [Microcoleus sp. FACHB-672]|uniref:hypothetical protein n=1 Tax=Microcoleus sp. FACHB-672 TaxID=2692825 RepID=UPI001685BDBD|nr:hypothetical protein [Microcoleus sp. FACHB-672]MBD2040681.1 hypothetical protein [Microcoleus sp. FACHB-672]
MHHRLNASQFLVGLLLCSSAPALILPALAHNVEISGDVAATFHLEPNHNPKAGEPAKVWFALTRKGGATIPLEKCDCQLAIFSLPRAANAKPLMMPVLKSINAERYKGIPGADVVFPKAGSYELEFSGSAKVAGDFRAFQMKYRVNVSR